MAAPLLAAANALQGLGVSVASLEGSGGFWPVRGVEGAPIRDRVMVLVTDGQVGNEDWIMGQLAPKLQVNSFESQVHSSVVLCFCSSICSIVPFYRCRNLRMGKRHRTCPSFLRLSSLFR